MRILKEIVDDIGFLCYCSQRLMLDSMLENSAQLPERVEQGRVESRRKHSRA